LCNKAGLRDKSSETLKPVCQSKVSINLSLSFFVASKIWWTSSLVKYLGSSLPRRAGREEVLRTRAVELPFFIAPHRKHFAVERWKNQGERGRKGAGFRAV